MVWIALVSLIVLLSISPSLGQERPGPPDFCINTTTHKEAPSPELETFEACVSWQSNSCCTPEIARSIDRTMALGQSNFSWELCGPLSPECLTYMENEECFYNCEPMLGYFGIGRPGVFRKVPVCSSYCNDWFEACKNDMTCVDNWLDSLIQANEEGMNTCPRPPSESCMTFGELYVDGRGLCDRLWKSNYFYSEDEDNCTVMAFDPNMPNPNYQLTFPSGAAATLMSSAWMIGVHAFVLVMLIGSY